MVVVLKCTTFFDTMRQHPQKIQPFRIVDLNRSMVVMSTLEMREIMQSVFSLMREC